MLALRWRILAVLFLARTAMAFQFQSVAAVSPGVMEAFGIGLADAGLLIGLYFAPGMVVALPGSALGRAFGDRRVVIAGLLTMIAGSLMMLLGESWGAQVAGRLIGGIGGVVLNVLMTKMVTDWFAGREISTAMAIFINSWPAGIALALLVLPALVTWYGLAAMQVAVLAVCAAGLAGILIVHRDPDGAAAQTAAATTGRLGRHALQGVVLAALVWAFFNAGLAMVFAFGTAVLTERGWTLAASGSVTSIVMWLIALSVPLGGVLADRTGRPDMVISGGLVAFAALLLLAAGTTTAVLPVFVVMGLLCGLPGGPIMSLPSRVLHPGNRALGMGVFFSVYYATLLVAPPAAGWLAEATGTADATFVFGAALNLAALGALWLFGRASARVANGTVRVD